MTRAELTLLTECGHEPTQDVAFAIRAAAKVGPTDSSSQVDIDTLKVIAETLGVMVERDRRIMSTNWNQYFITLTFMEVDAVIYARVNR